MLDFTKIPGVRFIGTIFKCFSPDSGQDNTLLHTMLRYAATIFFVIGGLTSIAYTYPTLYSVSLALLPEFWAKCATIAMVFFLFIVIDLLLSVSFPAVMEKIASGKAIRNRRTAFGTLALFALCGTLAWLSFTFSQSGSYTPAEAAVANNKKYNPADFAIKTAKVSSASEVEAIFEKDMAGLQDADDAKLAGLVAKGHKEAQANRAWAWKTYGVAIDKGDKTAITTFNNLCTQYAADSAKIVRKFTPNPKLVEMAERKQHAIIANQNAHSSVAETVQATTKVELDKDQRKVEAIQLLLGKVGSYATLIGLILTVVYVFLKSGEAAPPSPITPAPIRFLWQKIGNWKIFRGDGNSVTAHNQEVTNSGNLFGSYGNSNAGVDYFTVTFPDGVNRGQEVTETMSLGDIKKKFNQYATKYEEGSLTPHNVAMMNACVLAITYNVPSALQSLKELTKATKPAAATAMGWK
jgi:hypothetical protein